MSFIKSISQTPSAADISSNDILLGNRNGVTSKFNVSTVTHYLCSEYLQEKSFGYAEVNEINTTSTNIYTLQNSDINSIVTINNGANNTIIAITPEFQSISRIGAQVVLVQLGTGTITVSAIQESATIISSFDRYKLVGQNSVAAIAKISNSNWLLGGDTSL
jgi:hypothetical protein